MTLMCLFSSENCPEPQASFDVLLQDAPDTHSKALALSTSICHAGDWLNVISCPALDLHLLDWEFCSCLKYWFGV